MDSKSLASHIADTVGREPDEVEILINSLADVIAPSVRDGDAVVVPGFGTFEQKKRLERITIHPATGKRMLLPPKLSIVFKPSAVLRQKVRSNSSNDE